MHSVECIGTNLHDGFTLFQQKLEINKENVAYCSFEWHGGTVGLSFDTKLGLLSVWSLHILPVSSGVSSGFSTVQKHAVFGNFITVVFFFLLE